MREFAVSSAQRDEWSEGELYDSYMGRWSRLVAGEFIPWLGVPARKRWLDIGCGTGTLCQLILASTSPSGVKGIDPSSHFITFAREHIRDSRVMFKVGTTDSLTPVNGLFDAVVSGLALNFISDPGRALTLIKSVTDKGGIIGLYVWDYADKMELIRHFWDAAIALDRSVREIDEGRRFPLCRPEPLRELFGTAGLRNIEIRPIDVPTRFQNFDDYWSPFLSGQGPAPGYALSLSEEKRRRLRDRIRSRLPIADDGSIKLIARAWAIRGSVF